ncbi:kinase-like domain-containing protein [Mycena metata]|uniref:Kinase-like domain-containing protein n=1 Tax=Mycena metata TaxID=1033252 RepID=A0AAD7N8E0_9AGAR|nr:kinase-like domain-containing protein [Mycena metata]
MLPPKLPADVDPSDYDIDEWESLRPFLKSRGYRLITQRDAQAGAIQDGDEEMCEKWGGPPRDDDPLYHDLHNYAVFPGFQISNSQRVVFKIVDANKSPEAEIYSYLCETPAKTDPRNRVIPVLEIIELSPTHSMIVTEEWCLSWNDYNNIMETWDDFADFATQALEGLAFLHSHCIAHLDISDGNILVCQYAEDLPRTRPAYAFIDFGLSVRFHKSHAGPYTVTRNIATFEPPEMSKTITYDPFKSDIWQMGQVLVHAARQCKLKLDSLQALISRMQHADPDQRPTAEAALAVTVFFQLLIK